jgi:hypothetical protein
MSNDLVVPLSDMQHMAIAVARSGLFGVRTPDQALALMLVSQAEGRHPALAARDYDIIQGRPAKKAEAMLRDFLSSGGKVRWHELSDAAAEATFEHPQGGTVAIRWDTARARQAGLDAKEMYKKYPRQMLRSRVVSEGVRTVYPAATSGMYVPEEVRDITDEPVTAAVVDTTGTRLDDFASEARMRPSDATAEQTADPAGNGGIIAEPPRDILADARAASLRGVEAFRDFWVGLDQGQRNTIRDHLGSLEAAAKRADMPPEPGRSPPASGRRAAATPPARREPATGAAQESFPDDGMRPDFE